MVLAHQLFIIEVHVSSQECVLLCISMYELAHPLFIIEVHVPSQECVLLCISTCAKPGMCAAMYKKPAAFYDFYFETIPTVW
jgi:hypothetical protein